MNSWVLGRVGGIEQANNWDNTVGLGSLTVSVPLDIPFWMGLNQEKTLSSYCTHTAQEKLGICTWKSIKTLTVSAPNSWIMS